MFSFHQAPRSRKIARLISLLLPLAISQPCLAEASETATANSIDLALRIVFLVVIITGVVLAFRREGRHPALLIGIASISAACGVAIGFTSEALFGVLVTVLAAGYSGTLICAVRLSDRRSPKEGEDCGSCHWLASASATSGISLLLGAFFGDGIDSLGVLLTDVRRPIAVAILLIVTAAVVYAVARRKNERPLPFAGAAFGAFIGIATGLSMNPVISYVAPTCLTLFAGFASYSFSTRSEEEQKSIGKILFCFGILLIVGLFLGTSVRVGLGAVAIPRTLYAFAAIVLVSLALGIAIGEAQDSQKSLRAHVIELPPDFMSALGFALFGAGVGLSMGMSRTPIMHIVLPALLTVFAGVAAYAIAGRDDAAKVRARRGLLAAFGLTVLLGSFGGYALRDADLLRQLDAIDAKLKELGEETGDADPADVFLDPEEQETVAGAEEIERELLIWTEGHEAMSALLIEVGPAWSGVLEVRDRVNGRVIYRETPVPGSQVAQPGESLEIRWPIEDGRDGLSILGWNRLARTEEGWTVEGVGEPVGTDRAVREGDSLVLIYP